MKSSEKKGDDEVNKKKKLEDKNQKRMEAHRHKQLLWLNTATDGILPFKNKRAPVIEFKS